MDRKLRNGTRVWWNRDTDFQRDMYEGTSPRKLIKDAKLWITSRKGRLRDFRVFFVEERFGGSCCTDWLQQSFERAELPKVKGKLTNLPMPGWLDVECYCGARWILSMWKDIIQVEHIGLRRFWFVRRKPFQLLARHLEILPVSKCEEHYPQEKLEVVGISYSEQVRLKSKNVDLPMEEEIVRIM